MGSNRILGNFAHYVNEKCEFFPCHDSVDREEFNCLFCFCPLYALGPDCGGDFVYTAEGVKDCKACTKPHGPDSYDYIMTRIGRVTEMTKIKIKRTGEKD